MFLFKENKYSRLYAALIDRARAELRTKKDGIYYERHHCIPKSLIKDPTFWQLNADGSLDGSLRFIKKERASMSDVQKQNCENTV
jgi:hypothetical protein